MRQVVLDTETTGLDPAQGHKLIEIGCVEIINRRLTQRHYHQYLQPDREIELEAFAVHGIANEFLQDKPRFADIAPAFMAFIDGAELIIHNAPFDLGFINHELNLLQQGWKPVEAYCTVTDTLVMARQRHPGQKNNLDALCKRYNIDNSKRTLHGALLDSEILAELYLIMTGGQVSLLGNEQQTNRQQHISAIQRVAANRPPLPIITADTDELAAHEMVLTRIDKASGGQCVWRTLETTD